MSSSQSPPYKTIAIVPMRHHSQRVTQKNYRTLGNLPLYQHIIETILSCDQIEQLIIETDSPNIKAGVQEKYSGARITILDRPETHTSPEISMNQILILAVKRLLESKLITEQTMIIQTHATNPFLTTHTIESALEQFRESQPETLMTVAKYQKRLWTPDGQPLNHSPTKLLQTQDLRPVYEENSSLYLFTVKTLLLHQNRLGGHIKFYAMNLLESWDIDTEEDFQIAELILKHKKGTRSEQLPQHLNHDLLNYLTNELRDLTNEYQNVSQGEPTILISAPYMMPEIETFCHYYKSLGINTIVADVEERLSAEDLKKYQGQYQVALIGDDQFNAETLEKSNVKALCKWGTGIDSIDQEYCRDHQIPIYNTENAFSVPVSQSIMAAVLGFARQTFHSNHEMKNTNNWVKYPARTLEEMTIGIVGLGNIGRHLARFLSPFGPEILGYDIVSKIPAIPGITRLDSLKDLLNKSDIVCLCSTLNETSHHLINQNNIYQMKPHSYLINMARGPLIQETALVEAIQNNHLAGAALDVFEVEPLPESSQLRKLPNIIISSHNSNSSPKYWRKVHLNTIRNSLKALIRLTPR